MSAYYTSDTQKLTYEQPVSELVRHCLKVEKLSNSLNRLLDAFSPVVTDLALSECLMLLRLCERADIRTRMIQWLLNLNNKCLQWGELGAIEYGHLNDVKLQVEQLLFDLDKRKTRFKLSTDPFLKYLSLQDLSSGVSALNAPALQSWRVQPAMQCKEHILQWLSYVRSEVAAARFILKVLRSSVESKVMEAKDGFFQMSLDVLQPIQLIRVTPSQHIVYPQMSIGKQRFSIAFYKFDYSQEKFITQDMQSRSFELACCVC